jgi:photosystem II stability/assembly factor-like uncharacterized protein
MLTPTTHLVRAATLVALALSLLPGCGRRKPAVEAWEALPLGTDAEVNALWFSDSLNGWLAGGGYQIEGGLVGRTRDGGRTWSFTSGLATMEPGMSRFDLLAIRFLDARRGLVVSSAGKVFVSDDGGEQWRLVRYGRGLTDHLFALDFLDAENGWAAGLRGVLRTQDGGEKWFTLGRDEPDADPPVGHAIRFIDSWTGFMVGADGAILRSGDGGESWVTLATPLDPDERPRLYDLCFLDRFRGWVVGGEGVVLRTTDGGGTWQRLETGVPGARSHAVKEIIRRNRSVVDTFDLGGRTPGLTLTAVRFVDARRGWMTGHFGYEGRSVVLGTQDGGDTWTIEREVPGEELRALFVLDAEHAWAVGDRVRPGEQVLLRLRAGREASRPRSRRRFRRGRSAWSRAGPGTCARSCRASPIRCPA